MEALYHQTNRLLQEISHHDLNRIERSHSPEEYGEAETCVVQKLDTVHSNCNRLDILINKEPPARRVNAKYRVDQLKYDFQHIQVSILYIMDLSLSSGGCFHVQPDNSGWQDTYSMTSVVIAPGSIYAMP
ncbi:probable Golgi SNAP receptor complex member 2 [Penaeus japonicus]|uniref:probable Golgi SNAP receptor complex member 2 n=1 Tax=Penaeus japonicus TaxID=27405 RepID=UPI001C716612|nr:probable Golgi SNAP receptor complex member 2 [Penaeus japonicus]XP_042857264.1 probable Golgi SNAP receptor complex member 2 [Penaeus japonicus]XP_042857265.1 probable Golgi SNAP receptor complex member 2 [Penaeus japonicus]XP_042857266.1 probable Golgi SNAP receptor complex member 2 [Penaeus japonicus]XP_042857267.1 probable Golgi SNAP receptor complex member 2 [Penaeus japonicus]